MKDPQFFIEQPSLDLTIEDLLEVRGSTLVLKGSMETSNFLNGQSGVQVSQEGLSSSTSSLGAQTVTNLTTTGSFAHQGATLGFFGTSPVAQPSAIVNLTDSTTGTANDTVTDVGGAFNQATLNNNFADVTAKINLILNALRNVGIIDS